MSSILTDVKHKVGPSGDYTYYDRDIIDAINTAFGILTQIGVGPDEGFRIEDDTTEWTDFVTDTTTLNLVQSYIYIKVRLLFDPPTSSTFASALKEEATELEWRLNVQNDPERKG
jgi:hypothetical protein